jgi:DNA modification methylase
MPVSKIDVPKGDGAHTALARRHASSGMTDETNEAALRRARTRPTNQQTLPLQPRRAETTGGLEPALSAIYGEPIPSKRTGVLFNAHSYPTKINPLAVMACILAHTKPGDVVFDGFAGSGATGLGATLCGHVEQPSRAALESRIPSIEWGERNAVLYDLSELAAFLARSLLDAPDVDEFAPSAKSLLERLRKELSWMYEANDTDGSVGQVRHVLWTEHILCPACRRPMSFWDVAVETEPARIRDLAECQHCGETFKAGLAERVTETYWDDLTGAERKRRLRSPAYVYGITGRRRWKRSVKQEDLELLTRIAEVAVPDCVPIVRMLNSADERWGYMHRRGYHFGIEYIHDFYTRRNLLTVAKAWELTYEYPEHLQDALRFWISSYNSSHSTLMTRVVCKKSSDDFVLSGAQPAALYVGGLPVEKNVIAGLQRKLATITKAFAETAGRTNAVSVTCGSCLNTSLADESVDYIFTDPPFGDNIQYSEVNFISEAWLGRFTKADEEAVVSPVQGKSVSDYGELLLAAFIEAHRVLKPGKFMTVAFHSTQPDVWEALRSAWERAGFEIVATSILDKEQTSFKQTTTQGAAQKDPLILLRKPEQASVIDLLSRREPIDYWEIVDARIQLKSTPLDLAAKRHLFSYLVTVCLERGIPIPYSAQEFYAELDGRYAKDGDLHGPRD